MVTISSRVRFEPVDQRVDRVTPPFAGRAAHEHHAASDDHQRHHAGWQRLGTCLLRLGGHDPEHAADLPSVLREGVSAHPQERADVAREFDRAAALRPTVMPA